MRRLPRRATHVFVALSALLFVACVVAMVKNPAGARFVIDRGFGWADGGGVELAGFELREIHAVAGPIVVVRVPAWFVLLTALMALVAPARWLRERDKSNAAGVCPACSYDLRAHAEGERCPECGTAISRPLTSDP